MILLVFWVILVFVLTGGLNSYRQNHQDNLDQTTHSMKERKIRQSNRISQSTVKMKKRVQKREPVNTDQTPVRCMIDSQYQQQQQAIKLDKNETASETHCHRCGRSRQIIDGNKLKSEPTATAFNSGHNQSDKYELLIGTILEDFKRKTNDLLRLRVERCTQNRFMFGPNFGPLIACIKHRRSMLLQVPVRM